MLTPLKDFDRTQLVAALEHLVVAGLTAEKCHRELELVQLGTDLHPQLTVNYVYQRLAVVTARLQTAREQLEGVVQRAEQAAQLDLEAAAQRAEDASTPASGWFSGPITRGRCGVITREVFDRWADLFDPAWLTPVLALGVGHGLHAGELHLVVREDPFLTDEVLEAFLAEALRLLRQGRVSR